MKKKFFYTLMLAVIAIFPITFAGCGNKATISSISVIATNETFNYSAETNTISIVYGTNIELKKEDFRKEEILEQYRHFINGDELMNSALRNLIDKIFIYNSCFLYIVL